MVYFDNAGTTPPAPEVVKLVTEKLSTTWGQTTCEHWFSQKSIAEIEKARNSISQNINSLPENIFFTSGATEANNLVISSVCKSAEIQDVICSPLEHLSILKPLQFFEKEGLIKIQFLELDKFNNPKIEHLQKILSKNEKSFLAISHANHLTGNFIPVKKFAKICQKFNAKFLLDISQTCGYSTIDLQTFDVDFATASAHKFHGFAGAGFLFAKNKSEIKPQILGESMEYGIRAGHQNTLNTTAMAKALEITTENLDKNQKHIQQLTNSLKKLLSENFENIIFNTDIRENKLHKILNFSLPSIKKSKLLVQKLDLYNFAVSEGGFEKSLRISFSRENTEKEIFKFVETLKLIAK